MGRFPGEGRQSTWDCSAAAALAAPLEEGADA